MKKIILGLFYFLIGILKLSACDNPSSGPLSKKCFFDIPQDKVEGQLSLYVEFIDIIPVSIYRIDNTKQEEETAREIGVIAIAKTSSNNKIRYILINADPQVCFTPTIPNNFKSNIKLKAYNLTPKDLYKHENYTIGINELDSKAIKTLINYADKYDILDNKIFQLICSDLVPMNSKKPYFIER